MNPRAHICKRITCLLLLGMYVSFLCFQIKYNLESAHNHLRLCKLQVSWQSQDDNSTRVSAHARHSVLAKVKTAPSKRFHPKIAEIRPIVFADAPVIYIEREYGLSAPVYISFLSLLTCQKRGPPAA